jgi:hypothetical protein
VPRFLGRSDTTRIPSKRYKVVNARSVSSVASSGTIYGRKGSAKRTYLLAAVGDRRGVTGARAGGAQRGGRGNGLRHRGVTGASAASPPLSRERDTARGSACRVDARVTEMLPAGATHLCKPTRARAVLQAAKCRSSQLKHSRAALARHHLRPNSGRRRGLAGYRRSTLVCRARMS